MDTRSFLSNFRLVRKPSSRLTKIAVVGVIVLSVAALLALHSAVLNARAERDAYRQLAQELEQENRRLESQIENLGTAEGVEQIAKDELGMANPDDIILEPEN